MNYESILKPAFNIASGFAGMTVGAKNKNVKVGAATSVVLKSISGGNVLSLTDEHGHGLRLNVTGSCFN